MAVTRYYNPETDSWDLIGVGVQGPPGSPGVAGPEGDPGQPGTQIFYSESPPSSANFGDMWIDRNSLNPLERVVQDTLDQRPGANSEIKGMLFWASDQSQMYYCDGFDWFTLG